MAIYEIKNFHKINVVGKIYKVNLKLQAFADETGAGCLFIESEEPFIFLENVKPKESLPYLEEGDEKKFYIKEKFF